MRNLFLKKKIYKKIKIPDKYDIIYKGVKIFLVIIICLLVINKIWNYYINDKLYIREVSYGLYTNDYRNFYINYQNNILEELNKYYLIKEIIESNTSGKMPSEYRFKYSYNIYINEINEYMDQVFDIIDILIKNYENITYDEWIFLVNERINLVIIERNNRYKVQQMSNNLNSVDYRRNSVAPFFPPAELVANVSENLRSSGQFLQISISQEERELRERIKKELEEEITKNWLAAKQTYINKIDDLINRMEIQLDKFDKYINNYKKQLNDEYLNERAKIEKKILF